MTQETSIFSASDSLKIRSTALFMQCKCCIFCVQTYGEAGRTFSWLHSFPVSVSSSSSSSLLTLTIGLKEHLCIKKDKDGNIYGCAVANFLVKLLLLNCAHCCSDMFVLRVKVELIMCLKTQQSCLNMITRCSSTTRAKGPSLFQFHGLQLTHCRSYGMHTCF